MKKLKYEIHERRYELGRKPVVIVEVNGKWYLDCRKSSLFFDSYELQVIVGKMIQLNMKELNKK